MIKKIIFNCQKQKMNLLVNLELNCMLNMATCSDVGKVCHFGDEKRLGAVKRLLEAVDLVAHVYLHFARDDATAAAQNFNFSKNMQEMVTHLLLQRIRFSCCRPRRLGAFSFWGGGGANSSPPVFGADTCLGTRCGSSESSKPSCSTSCRRRFAQLNPKITIFNENN